MLATLTAKFLPTAVKLFKDWKLILIVFLAGFVWVQSNTIERRNTSISELKVALQDVVAEVDLLKQQAVVQSEITQKRNQEYKYYEQQAKILEQELNNERKLSRAKVQEILNRPTPETSSEAVQLLRDALELQKLKEFDQ